MDIVKIDGSWGEGGGQIIRTGMTMSAIMQMPITIFNARLQRQKPGLQPQHLMACRAVEQICSGQLVAAELGSSKFSFYPGVIKSDEYNFNIGTAGSAILVAQTVIPILLQAKQESLVRITGGTNVPKSPGYDYFENVFLPAIKRFSANVEVRLIQSGYFPRGSGVIELTIKPSRLVGCSIWQRDHEIYAIIRLANLPAHIAEREKQVLNNFGIRHIQIYEEQTASPGNTITIWQDFKGGCELGVRGKLAEQVANDAYFAFKNEKGDVDRHLADQLLIYAALAHGKTHYRSDVITDHLKTNHFVITKFLQRKIVIDEHNIVVE